jgi:hypothetical protein
VVLLTLGLLAGCGGSASTSPAADDAAELAVGLLDQLPTDYGIGSPPSTAQPAPGVLMTPHSAQRITAVEVGDELDPTAAGLLGLSSPDRQVAPAGHDVVVVSLTASDLAPPFRPDPDQGVAVTTELVIGDERTAITPFTGFLGNAGAGSPSVWTQPDVTLVVVAPTDAPLLFSVTEEGYTASLDLRTGERLDDPGTSVGAVYYTGRFAPVAGTASGVGAVRMSEGTVVDPAAEFGLSLADRSVVLSPWLPGRGWAAAGRAWASLQVDAETTANGFVTFATISVDPTTTFTLTGPDGVPLPALPGTTSVVPSLTPVAGGSLGAVWDVPAGLTGGTVDVAADIALSYQDAPWSWDGPTLSIPAVPFSFPA